MQVPPADVPPAVSPVSSRNNWAFRGQEGSRKGIAISDALKRQQYGVNHAIARSASDAQAAGDGAVSAVRSVEEE